MIALPAVRLIRPCIDLFVDRITQNFWIALGFVILVAGENLLAFFAKLFFTAL